MVVIIIVAQIVTIHICAHIAILRVGAVMGWILIMRFNILIYLILINIF